MPLLRLGRFELEEYGLPPVCMLCGGPTKVSQPTTLSWHPPAVSAVLLFGFPGLLLFLILVAVLRKRIRVPVSLCQRHRHYWRHRNLLIYGGLLATVGMSFGGLILLLLVNGTFSASIWNFFCLGNVSIVLTWFIALGALEKSGMRVIEITARGITLAGVSKDFIDAVRRDQRGDIS